IVLAKCKSRIKYTYIIARVDETEATATLSPSGLGPAVSIVVLFLFIRPFHKITSVNYKCKSSHRFQQKTTLIMETRYYEGCGREGPIRCIFLGEFHPVAGPKIACQFPEDFISKDLFDSLSTYIIPKPILQKKNITFNAPAHKILGYPIYLKSPRYPRNVYVFNLCFVCDNWSRTVQYEPVVKKLGEHLITLEEESAFVSGGSSRLPTFLAHLLYDLNTYRKTTVTEGDTIIHVKVTEIRNDPSPVNDHDVPVLVASIGQPRPGTSRNSQVASDSTDDISDGLDNQQPMEIYTNSNWDLTTKQLLPYINGYYHVAKIAAKVNVEKTLVKACIRNLVYYGVVKLIPLLKFSNMYRATAKLNSIKTDLELQNACLSFIRLRGKRKPRIEEVLQVLSLLQQGTSLRSVSERFHAICRRARFDVRNLIVFTQMHGLVRCLKRYPTYCQRVRSSAGSDVKGLQKLFTGERCTDEICCLTSLDMASLERVIEDDPNVAVILC
ncbi:PREDICTED: nitrogen permease regulator 2-like protein, partial [Papilio polytes]|uniref:nitrogen permease regulator 2-like protein n=1 Tax=Papilio polytes TaxID=76194 RepID=UPI0006767AD4